jgi:hypothetical protein
MARFPILEHLGELAPAKALTDRAFDTNFNLDCFSESAIYPKEFIEFLDGHGYEPDDYGSTGMLFASTFGVGMHCDEFPAALWVLGGEISTVRETHTLVVGGKHLALKPGSIILFDSRKKHGVIAGTPGRWAVFSTYVRRKKAKNSAACNLPA